MTTTRAQENLNNAATIPNSNIAPELAIPSKKTKKTKKTSVQRLNEDLAAEAAGPPLKLTRTECILEDSGISIPAKSAEIVPASIINAEDATSPVKSPSELPPPENTIGHSESDSGCISTSPEETPSELQPPEITANYSTFGSDSGSEFDDDAGSIYTDESEDMVTPHKVADGKRPRSDSAISPSVSHHAKSGQLSVAHSSATSGSVTCEPSPTSLQSDLSVIEDDLQGSSKVIGEFSHGRTILYNMADKDNEMEVDFATPQPICGKVLLYLDCSVDASPHTSMNQDVQSKLAPVLEKLSGCHSPVASKLLYYIIGFVSF
ncbi:hypothetical protein BDQ12DRAFT_729191 [Crucibulum laeve]|uniref:Uncharacterized protein n=1 Tax=Crucibulum laeve TaxID=68775 RepID=A0A5C3LG28_9AGAR|nr:hypothetical protein BDQ12DRAFT_729191 [Crucibulum laeve]